MFCIQKIYYYYISSLFSNYFFQYQDSTYKMIQNSIGSWNDAEEACDGIGSTLWAVNSYAEWWHLSSSFGIGSINKELHIELKVDSIKLSSTVLLFIGQRFNSEVIFSRAYVMVTQ